MKSFSIKNHAVSRSKHSRRTTGTKAQYLKELLLSGCGVVAVTLLINVGTSYFLQNNVFGLRELKITGCQLSRPEDIASCAHIQKGMNLLSIDLMHTTAQLERYPYVYKAVLRRKLPGTLEIYVEERKPRGAVKLEDFYLVDEHGEIFKKAEPHELHYPLLTGLTKDDLYRDGQRCMEIIRTALQLLDCVEQDERFRGAALEIAMDKNSGFTIITAPEHLEISVGFDAFAEKLQSLWKIVDDLKGRGLTPQTIYLKSAQKAYITLNGVNNGFSHTTKM